MCRLTLAFGSSFALFLMTGAAHAQPSQNPAPDRARALEERARQLAEADQLVEAETTYREALREYERRAANGGADVAYRLRGAKCRNELAQREARLMQHAEAQALVAATVPMLQALTAEAPKDPEVRFELAATYRRWARCQSLAGFRVEAAARRREGLDILRKLVDEHPGSAAYRRERALALNRQGAELMQLARYQEGEAAYQDSLRLGRTLVRDVPRSPDDIRQRSFHLQQFGRFREAQADTQRVAELDERLEAPLLRLVHIRSYLQDGDVTRALTGADDLFLGEELSDSQWYELAEIYAAAADKTGAAAAKEPLAARAVECLRDAIERGYTSNVPLGDRPPFRALRGRPDFPQLAAKAK